MKKAIFLLLIISLFVVGCTTNQPSDKEQITENHDVIDAEGLPIDTLDNSNSEELSFNDSDLDDVSSLMNEW